MSYPLPRVGWLRVLVRSRPKCVGFFIKRSLYGDRLVCYTRSPGFYCVIGRYCADAVTMQLVNKYRACCFLCGEVANCSCYHDFYQNVDIIQLIGWSLSLDGVFYSFFWNLSSTGLDQARVRYERNSCKWNQVCGIRSLFYPVKFCLFCWI